MGKPGAKKGDNVVGVDTHIVLIPAGPAMVPTPLPHAFRGPLSASLSTSVFIDEQPAAIVGSGADNSPPHIAAGGTFQSPPSDAASIQSGSPTVFADDTAMARNGDPAICCNDPTDAPTGRVMADSTVIID